MTDGEIAISSQLTPVTNGENISSSVSSLTTDGETLSSSLISSPKDGKTKRSSESTTMTDGKTTSTSKSTPTMDTETTKSSVSFPATDGEITISTAGTPTTDGEISSSESNPTTDGESTSSSESTPMTDSKTSKSESTPKTQGITTDERTTSERPSSARVGLTGLTTAEFISGTPEITTKEDPENDQISDIKTTISEAALDILISKTDLSTIPTTVRTSSSVLTSGNEIPFLITPTDSPSFTSDEEHISTMQLADFTSSLVPEDEYASPSTRIVTLPEKSITPDVTMYSSTENSYKTDFTHQSLSSELIDFSEQTSINMQTTVYSDPSSTGVLTTIASKHDSGTLLTNIAVDPTSTIMQSTDSSNQTPESSTPEKVIKTSIDTTVFTTAEENLSTKSPDVFCSCGKCRMQNPDDCTNYFECINGEYVSKQCAVGYLFSSILEGCGKAENIECSTHSEQCLISNGFFADANDCSSYVQCYNGISYKKTCPRGLLYNPVKRTCDEKSNCGAQPVLPTSRNLDIDCDCDYCIMGDSEDCSKYYLCLNGVSYEETCSDGLLFNSKTATCDYEMSASCASPSPECTTKNGDFPVPGNCSLYYHCVGGVAYEKECRAGLHFSAERGQCEEVCKAGCDSSLECPFNYRVPLCLSPDDFYPNPEDCRTFYECSEGKPKLAECIDGEHFNSVEEICQDPCEAMCDPNLNCVNSTASEIRISEATATSPTSSWLSSEETEGSEDPISHTFTSDEPTSRMESTETENTSSMDQISTELYSSIHPETNSGTLNPKYTSRTTRYITSSELFPDETTETSPTTYSAFCPEPTGVFPDHEECRALFLCIDGYPMKLYCDDHLHFNPLTKRCEPPCSALCDPTVDCSTTEEPESPTPFPLTLCRTKDFLPKHGSCKHYYDCTRSRLRKKQKCPKGLQFNPTKRVCDLPQNSGCGELPKDLPVPDLFYQCPCEACLMPSTHNCLEYFLCLGFKAYRMKCSDGLLFDQRQNTCNVASKVICDLPTTTTFTPYSSTQETYTTATEQPYTKETSPTDTSYETSKQPFTRPYTTSTTKQSYTTPISTIWPYTTSTTKQPSTMSISTSNPFMTSTTTEPFTTSTLTSKLYTTSTTKKPHPASTPTSSPYRTSTTTKEPTISTSTSRPYTTSTTKETYPTSTSTSIPYTTSTSTKAPTSTPTSSLYTTSTTENPYSTSTSTSRPSTTSKPTSIPYTTSTITESYTTPRYTGRPHTTSTAEDPYTTITSTYRTFTTSEIPPSTSRPHTSSTTGEPYTTSTRSHYITSTTVKPPTTLTSTSRSYTTSTTRKPYKTSTSIPYTTTRKPNTTSTSNPYTTSTTKPITIPTSTTKKPYTMSTSTNNPYSTSTTTKPYITTTKRPYPTSTTTTKRPYPTSTTTTKRPYPKSSTTTRPSSTISPSKGSFRCPEANGMFRNPEDCGSFMHCSNFLPYLKECPGGLHFSIETQRCEYPCDAKCDKTLSCVSSSAVPRTTPNPSCPCKNCLRPHPESCTKYFECRAGQPTTKECPKGQTFDTTRSGCNWAHRVNCQHSEVCPNRNGIFPHKDCHKFVHCSNGIPYTKVCPPRLQFDPTTLRCTFAAGPCGSVASMNETKGNVSPPAPGHPQWHCPTLFGYYRHEGKCNQYYQCVEGVAVLKICPEGLFFNSKYGTCDWPNNVKCSTSQSHLERRCRVFRDDFRCPSNRSYASSSHCDMFFDCRTGKACIKTCPEGLFFNSDTLMCDLPVNVRCMKSDGSSYSLKRFSEICRHGYTQQAVDPATDKCYYKCYRDKVRRYCCSRNRTYNERRGMCERKTLFQYISE